MAAISTLANPNDLFDKDIFVLLGLEDAPQDRKDKMMSDMMETIEGRVTARVVDALEEAASLDKFEELMDAGKQEDAEALLEQHGLNVAEITAQETLLYKAEMVSLISGVSLSQLQPAS